MILKELRQIKFLAPDLGVLFIRTFTMLITQDHIPVSASVSMLRHRWDSVIVFPTEVLFTGMYKIRSSDKKNPRKENEERDN